MAPLRLTLAELQSKYAGNLHRAIKQYPEQYAYTSDEAPTVASRIFETIARSGNNVKNVNVNGHAWKYTCTECGIPHTRKAINKYLNTCAGNRV